MNVAGMKQIPNTAARAGGATIVSRRAHALFAAAGLLLTSPAALADLMLFPTRIVFEKNQRAAQLELINQGKEPETYRLSLVNRRMNETGDFAPADTAEPGEQFADAMVRFSPRQVTIAPGSSQTVRMLLRKPADLAPGEYRSHLQIDRVAEPAGSGSIEAAADSGKIGVTLTALVGASIPVIVREGDTQAQVSLTQLTLLSASAEPATIGFEIDRGGNRSVYGDLTVTFTPKGGTPVEVARAGGVAVYVPNPLRKARMPLRLPEGAMLSGGSLRVTYRERADAGGKLMAEANLPLP
jgi:fimbrial chaperone protein